MNIFQRIWYRFFVSNSFIKIHCPGVPDNELPRTFSDIDKMSERRWQATKQARAQYVAGLHKQRHRL